MRYVYLLRSVAFPRHTYIGIIENLKQRIADHNSGKSKHTSKFKPWTLVVAIRFENDDKAMSFEKYLKSGSGHAFANRHLW
jgi:putative endonuclease